MSSLQILVPRSPRRLDHPARASARPDRERERRAAGRAERDRDGDPALPALRRHPRRDRAGRRGARGRGRRRELGALPRVRDPVRRGCHRGADEPRLLRPLDEVEARPGDARPRRRLRRRVRGQLGRVAVRLLVAVAPDRDGDRAAQLLRGARDRPGGRERRDQPRSRPDRRLRAAQRDRGLRDRGAALRRSGAAVLEASSACSA